MSNQIDFSYSTYVQSTFTFWILLPNHFFMKPSNEFEAGLLNIMNFKKSKWFSMFLIQKTKLSHKSLNKVKLTEKNILHLESWTYGILELPLFYNWPKTPIRERLWERHVKEMLNVIAKLVVMCGGGKGAKLLPGVDPALPQQAAVPRVPPPAGPAIQAGRIL